MFGNFGDLDMLGNFGDFGDIDMFGNLLNKDTVIGFVDLVIDETDLVNIFSKE